MSSGNNNPPSIHQPVEVTELFDVQDADIGGYIQELINSCTQIYPVKQLRDTRSKRLDFSASEDAYAALAIVERVSGHIASRMRIVRALRILLRSRQPGQEFDMQ